MGGGIDDQFGSWCEALEVAAVKIVIAGRRAVFRILAVYTVHRRDSEVVARVLHYGRCGVDF